MKSPKKKADDISPTFFLEVMNHWATPGTAGAVVGLSLLLLCSGPWGITLGVAALFTGLMFSAARFWGSSTRSQKKSNTFSPRILFHSEPVSDPLEKFLELLYGVDPEQLYSISVDTAIDPDSPLINAINKIKNDGAWGTELHVDYLARWFDIPYRVVGVSGDNKVLKTGSVASLNPGKSDEIQQGYTHCIQLINHGGAHWTTMFGKEPVLGEAETRHYINNPGRGDCMFFAFSLGLARQLCEGVGTFKDFCNQPLLRAWRQSDVKMQEKGVRRALYQLGTTDNPLDDTKPDKKWHFFQGRLRHLVADYMCKQLVTEGVLALQAYQKIHVNQAEKNKLITELYDSTPLYREFDMLYNLDKKGGPEDLATNIFKGLHQNNNALAYTV